MALVAPDGGWLSVNEALCRIVGYAPEGLYRRTSRDITYPPDLDTDLALLRQLEAGKVDQYQLEKRYVRRDGRLVRVNLNVTKKTGRDGELLYYTRRSRMSRRRRGPERSCGRSTPIWKRVSRPVPGNLTTPLQCCRVPRSARSKPNNC
jgi:PAS domain S-box-containing protein